jgi:general L-amino acid transport system permease protein
LTRLVAWAKTNLFGSWVAGAITLGLLALLAGAALPALKWALLDAVFGAAPTDCANAAGACWGFVAAQGRLLLFGTYPVDETWRPALTVGLIVVLFALSTLRSLWRRELAYAWGAVMIVCLWLMGGGLGLRPVATEQWGGLPLTMLLTLIGEAVALPLGILLALGRRSSLPAVRTACTTFIELVRGVPLISILFMAALMFPLLLPDGLTFDKLLRAQIAIILFSAAYLAEIVRGGLQALPPGQGDAANALGLRYWQGLWLVILPQAMRMVIPGLVNSFIGALKDTSLVAVIGMFDLMGTGRLALADPIWRQYPIEGYLTIAALYYAMCRGVAYLGRKVEAAPRW